MTNAEVIQTMTVAELEKALRIIRLGWIPTNIEYLRSDSQTGKHGLLTEDIKKYWKIH